MLFMSVSRQEWYNNKLNWEGRMKLNYQGSLMIIVEYNETRDIVVEFIGYGEKSRVKTQKVHFLEGQVKNPYFKEVVGVGCQGKTETRVKGVHKKSYKVWISMLQRCYDDKVLAKKPYYRGCTVCERWLCYEYFEEDYNKMILELNHTGEYQLEKDIMVKENKIYSPETCCLVPPEINYLFRNRRENGYPTGIKPHGKRFSAQGSNKSYETVEEAFSVYKTYKEKLIKQKAEEYYKNNLISKATFDAMVSWEVEITD